MKKSGEIGEKEQGEGEKERRGGKEKSGELDAKTKDEKRRLVNASFCCPSTRDTSSEISLPLQAARKQICKLTHSLNAPSVLNTSPAPFPCTSHTTTQSHHPPISDPPTLGPPSTGPLFLLPCLGSYSGIGIVLGAGFFVSRNLTESLSMRGIV